MLDKTELEQALQELVVEAPQVQVVGGPMFIATVTSKSFLSENEAERQARVWKHLRERLAPEDLVQIEFVFTNAPGDNSAEADDGDD